MKRLIGFLARPLARRAVEQCYGIPYDEELTPLERLGMVSLERAGEVHADVGYSEKLHWHSR